MSLKFTALTIREGDAFLLEDNEWCCLFDSGVNESIIDLLKYQGVNKLNLAICSHNDADHADGFISLLKSNFPIDEIWLPGLWASVLQFVKENGIGDKDIKCDDEFYNGELESLFSEESVSCDSFNQELSDWNEQEQPDTTRLYERLHDKIVDHICENPVVLYQLLDRNIQNQFMGEEPSKEQLVDYLQDQLDCPPHYITRRRARILAEDFLSFRNFHHINKHYLLHKLKRLLNFKLNKIIEIARLARQHGCAIRWFEPTFACSKKVLVHDFVPLNSNEIMYIRKPKSLMAYFCMLKLTDENKYSLVFEYTKNENPIIRFSADSNCTCQSKPYTNNIIITAPHHGSIANSIVYNQLSGDDIIWVRSDERSKKRPCDDFKKQPNKYCLACDKFNFVSEICFEYSTWDQKWHHVRGEQCRCK